MEFKAHVFICTNKKEGKPCCAGKNAEELRQKLKSWAKAEFGTAVRINACGCLDQCSQGIAAVIYPSAQWFCNLTVQDENILKEAIRSLVNPNSP